MLCERLELDGNEVIQVQSERECQVARNVFQRIFNNHARRQVSQFDRAENRRTRTHRNHILGDVYKFDRTLGGRMQTYRNLIINQIFFIRSKGINFCLLKEN